MYSIRRLFVRGSRGSKTRIQIVILISIISLLGLFLYIQRHDTPVGEQQIIDQNTIPLKRKFITEAFDKVEEGVGGPSNSLPSSGSSSSSSSESDPHNCAYKHCSKLRDDVINVHVICHTHLDPGWLNSVDGYFFGINYARNTHNNGQVYRHSMPSVLTIFNNVMAALLENSQRRFVMVEMSFIWRWWKRLDEDYKKIVRKLMEQGRLDIAGGSWTSNDEAVSHYAAMIDQCTLGFRFLKTELRSCPQPAVAWQLDLFGHGKEINSLFAQMGYDGIMFGRLDYQEKNERTNQKTLQMIWKVNENAPENEKWLFTGILPNLYHPPETLGLKSDTSGSLLRPGDTDTIPESASAYSSRLLDELEKQQERYNSKNIAVIYGGDFEYEDATQYFQNIDAMIETINAVNRTGRKKFHVHYSTPSCFLHAISKENRSWPIREGDFMSYAHRSHAFWTGFYTSRPGIKFYERSLSALYQSLRQLSITADRVDFTNLFGLSEIMGLLQHHDTITGTSPSINIHDILQRMHQTEQKAQLLALSLYQRILTPDMQKNWSKPLIFCRLNESYCSPLGEIDGKFSTIVYNPSSFPTSVWLRIPVEEQQTIALDADTAKKHSIDAEDFGMIPLSPTIREIPLPHPRTQLQELIVRVNVPALSLQAIPFTATKTKANVEPMSLSQTGCSIENQKYVLTVNERGAITTLKIKSINKEIDFQQNFAHYISSGGDQFSHQSSGLYVFRPVGIDPPRKMDLKQFYCLKRKGYEEIIQVYSRHVNQSIRLLDKSSYIEFDWIVGRLESNMEVVTIYKSEKLNNSGVFYTDSSGRSLLKRRRDQRDGYTFTQSIKSAGNYYPLVSGIVLKDVKEDLQLSVVTDRAQGGGSIEDGAAELMIHRRVAADDGLGVSETLQEVGIDNQGLMIRGRHLVAVGKIDDGVQFFREHALKSVWKPIIAFHRELADEVLAYKTWSLVTKPLPEQVHILTIEPLKQETNILTVLFRIEHVYDEKEHSTLSKPISIDVQQIFDRYKVIEAKEVTLGANMYKDQAFERLKWEMEPPQKEKQKMEKVVEFNGKTIELRPMEIRSFHIKLNRQ